jgi:hypothetical protein
MPKNIYRAIFIRTGAGKKLSGLGRVTDIPEYGEQNLRFWAHN